MAKQKMKIKKRESTIGLERGLPTVKLTTEKVPDKSKKRAKPRGRQYYCRHCRQYHFVNSKVGRLHARPSYWRKKAKARKRR